MLPCNRRQKVVNRKEKRETLRCISKKSPANGQEVTEDICLRCPVREFMRKPPCKTLADEPAPTPEMDKHAAQEIQEIVQGTPLEELEVEGLDLSTPTDSPEYPAVSMQLWLYKEALMRWKKAGFPVRSDQEVQTIHETKCKPCSWYDAEKKRCKGCGCKVSAGSVAVFNKIKMATEHCPKEEW